MFSKHQNINSKIELQKGTDSGKTINIKIQVTANHIISPEDFQLLEHKLTEAYTPLLKGFGVYVEFVPEIKPVKEPKQPVVKPPKQPKPIKQPIVKSPKPSKPAKEEPAPKSRVILS